MGGRIIRAALCCYFPLLNATPLSVYLEGPSRLCRIFLITFPRNPMWIKKSTYLV